MRKSALKNQGRQQLRRSIKLHLVENKHPASEPSSKIPSALSLLGNEVACRESACENLALISGYCRLHYIKNWKKIKQKQALLSNGRFRQYIHELVFKYPDKYIEAVRQDLMSDERLSQVVMELEPQDSLEMVEEEPSPDHLSGREDRIQEKFEK